jgi:hypothetical protein
VRLAAKATKTADFARILRKTFISPGGAFDDNAMIAPIKVKMRQARRRPEEQRVRQIGVPSRGRAGFAYCHKRGRSFAVSTSPVPGLRPQTMGSDGR